MGVSIHNLKINNQSYSFHRLYNNTIVIIIDLTCVKWIHKKRDFKFYNGKFYGKSLLPHCIL